MVVLRVCNPTGKGLVLTRVQFLEEDVPHMN